MTKYTISLNDISADLIEQCGGKGAYLGELTKAGFNVPSGFCIISDAYFNFLRENRLEEKIEKISSSINFDDYEDVDIKTGLIRGLIQSSPWPEDYGEILDSYRKLSSKEGQDAYVAVRSSVAVKGTSISSFPGMMDTYHYIRGEEEVINKVKECWASLWTARAAMLRFQKGIDHGNGIIAPVIQKMVNPTVAGVAFTANPISLSKDEIVIESTWGLGEAVVSGKAMTDFFVLEKGTLSVKEKRITKKNIMYGIDNDTGNGRKEYPIASHKQKEASLTDYQLNKLGQMAKSIEDYFGLPQDIEWAFEDDTLYFLQARKIKGLAS